MISFKQILGGAAKVVSAVEPEIQAAATGVNPLLGLLVGVISPAIMKAAADPKLSAVGMKASVVDALEAAVPQLTPLMQNAGLVIQDPAKFAQGGDALIEAVLKITQAMGMVPSASKPAAKAPVTPPSLPVATGKQPQVSLAGYNYIGDELTLIVKIDD